MTTPMKKILERSLEEIGEKDCSPPIGGKMDRGVSTEDELQRYAEVWRQLSPMTREQRWRALQWLNAKHEETK